MILKVRRFIGIVSCVLMVGMCVRGVSADPMHLYVARDGNDAWTGRLASPNKNQTDGPMATLPQARDSVRTLLRENQLPEGAIIEVREGTYILDTPFELPEEDSGTEEAPIVYRATVGKQVRLLGGKLVNNWKRVDDTAILDRLDPSARDQLMCADLKELGITEFGSPAGGGIELFFDGQAMTVSRWPNEGFSRIAEVLGSTEVDIRGTKGCAEGIFAYDSDRPDRWTEERDAWVHGYWFWDWSEQRHKIKSIDTDRHVIEVDPPYHGYGYRKGQWFYGFNLLSEIDQPGEWYVDRESGMLYFWPPSPVEESEAIVSVIPTLINMQDVSHVSLDGFILEGTRGTAITMSGGSENRIVGCTIRNVGGWAVQVSDGTHHGVVGCDMSNMGGGGISLSGGDRTTLTPAGHFAENNHVHHYARVKRVYQPGITLQGVGNRASHNLIHNAPHMGMGFGGNDHLIELNEIHSVCYESNDAGAIYTGRNWTMRGTVIRNNYLHHITGFEGRGCVGVYLDDMFCGTEISGNLFYRVTRAAFIGGGRDCVVKGNLFVDCNPSLHIDARALGWAHDHSDEWVQEGREKGTLSGIRYNEPPYSERYPELINILDEEPAAPRGNRVFANVSFGGKWDEVNDDARKYVTIESNLVDRDPHFQSPDQLSDGTSPRPVDFALKPDSPAWQVGFEQLPLEKMGIYQDENRVSWPVMYEVR
ncbi:MAG: right-handed parallel beta-helix repeat-containing protein [Planctomycetaceae bacterium]